MKFMKEENENLKTQPLTEKGKEEVVKQIQESIKQDNQITEEQQKLFEEMLKEADMPVLLTNADFTLGKQELDIRKLNKENFNQMMFRVGVMSNIYGKQILSALIDIERFLMILCDKLGIEDIVKATDDILDKIKEQQENKTKLVK